MVDSSESQDPVANPQLAGPQKMAYNQCVMLPNNDRLFELQPSPPPRVFRLTQSAGLLPQSMLWGSTHEAPATLSNCHLAISRALATQQPSEFIWWSAMLDRHLGELVTGYMDGCRSAHHWNVMEIARVHWYAFAVKARLRGAKHFPALWTGAGRSLTALELIHSS